MFDDERCCPCAGSGWRSPGVRCFRCGGRGRTLTALGCATRDYLFSLRSRPAAGLQTGDRFEWHGAWAKVLAIRCGEQCHLLTDRGVVALPLACRVRVKQTPGRAEETAALALAYQKRQGP